MSFWKKILIVLALLVVLAIAGGVWLWHSLGFVDCAALVPSKTVALITLPNAPRTAMRWPQTILYQIGAEPQVKGFLEKPLQFLTQSKQGGEASTLLINLRPTTLFGAVVGLSSQESAGLIGFQFWSGKGDYDAAMGELRRQINGGKEAATKAESYQGDEILSSQHGHIILFTARHGRWGFISNNQTAIHEALDRLSGRLKETLEADPDYREVQSHLLKEADLTIFLHPQPIVDALLAVGTSLGAQPIVQQVDQIRKIGAIGGAIKCDGLNLHDAVFVLRKDPPDVGKLSHATLKFTTPNTMLYFDFLMDFQRFAALGNSPSMAPFFRSPGWQNAALRTLVPESFGPEGGLACVWNEGDLTPHGVLMVQVRNQEKAQAALKEFLTLFPQSTITDLGGVPMYNFPSLQMLFFNPSVALMPGFLVIGMDSPDIKGAMEAFHGKETLANAPDFTFASPEFERANEVFGYIDSRAIFERGYPLLRQVLTFSAAVMPGTAEMIDANKLPETETIARHLQPIVYAQTRLNTGYLIESKGPITMNQALILGSAAAASFFKHPSFQ